MTGKRYRLLTEAEWEYTARAGTAATYYWGEEIGKASGNRTHWDPILPPPTGTTIWVFVLGERLRPELAPALRACEYPEDVNGDLLHDHAPMDASQLKPRPGVPEIGLPQICPRCRRKNERSVSKCRIRARSRPARSRCSADT
jgi:hypothetical protein